VGAVGPVGPTGPSGPAGPAGAVGSVGPIGPASITEIGSFVNNGAQTLTTGSAIPFNQTISTVTIALDTANTTVTLGSSPYYRISFGVNAETFATGTTIQVNLNGSASGRMVPAYENGVASLEWTASFPANAKVQFVVASGSITLAAGSDNAYLDITGFRL
jgi:hypothetical protein